MPVQGVARLTRYGSMRDRADLSLIEAILDRASRYRTAWLERVSRFSPNTFRDAQLLNYRLRAAAKDWPAIDPEQAEIYDWTERGVDVAASLAPVPVETILTAMALNWLSTGTDNWVSRPVWEDARLEMLHSRKHELRRAQQGQLAELLRESGVRGSDAEEYLAEIGEETKAGLLYFPFRGFDRYEGPEDRRYTTTDFLVRLGCFDPAWIYAYYADSKSLESLDLARIKPLVDDLISSSEEPLREIGRMAIRSSATKQQAYHEVMIKMFRDGALGAWQDLVLEADAPGRATELRGLIDHARWCGKEFDQALFWRYLEQSGCLHPEVVTEAITDWQSMDNDEHQPRSSDDQATRQCLRSALSSYLTAAMSDRDPRARPLDSPAAYRAWFAEHPAPK